MVHPGTTRDDEQAIDRTKPAEMVPRIRLMAAAPDLVRALLAVEWEGDECETTGTFVSCCPECCALASSGVHEPDCSLDAALKKAGVR